MTENNKHIEKRNPDSFANKLNGLFSKNDQNVHANNEPVKKVLLSEYGFQQAGLNKGDASALENFLHGIKEGHVVDISFSETEHQKRKAEIENKITDKNNHIIDNQGEAAKIDQVLVPEKTDLINEKKEEIKKINIDKIEGRISSEYNKSKHLLFKILIWVLGIYLVIFYASAIDSAFFRNLLKDISENATANNISLLMNSIFNPYAIFDFKPSILFIYFGSSLFFAVGLLAHINIRNQKKPAHKVLVGIISFALPLIADFLIALKIHQNIIDAKALMGMTEEYPWYLSTNFYLVIVFGYFAYMAWAMLYEASQKEAAKKNMDQVAEFMIKTIKKEITALKDEIKQLKIKLEELKTNIHKLQKEVENLKNQLNKVLQDPNLLYRNLHNFYEGWLRYLNAGENNDKVREKCDKAFDDFMKLKFNPNSIVNN